MADQETMTNRSFYCGDELWKRLRQEAHRRSLEEDRHVTMSELIREGIRQVTSDEE